MDSLPVMTPAVLRKAAVEQEGYETPELNDSLYLHFRGFRKIENLEPYTGLKALWLEANGLEKIEGLSHLLELRCLFLQRNLLSSLDGLQGLTALVTLDVSENRLTTLDGLAEAVPALETLNVSRNALSEVSSVAEVANLKNLKNLNMEHNHLDGPGVIEVLASAASLCGVNIAGNPCNGQPHFRKKCIVAMPTLAYLDRPIFELERCAAEAWAVGGVEAEQAARRDFAQRKRDADKASMAKYKEWQQQCRVEWLERQQMTGQDSQAVRAAAKRAEEIREALQQERRDEQHEAEKAALCDLGKLGDLYYAGGQVDARRKAPDYVLQHQQHIAQAADAPPPPPPEVAEASIQDQFDGAPSKRKLDDDDAEEDDGFVVLVENGLAAAPRQTVEDPLDEGTTTREDSREVLGAEAAELPDMKQPLADYDDEAAERVAESLALFKASKGKQPPYLAPPPLPTMTWSSSSSSSNSSSITHARPPPLPADEAPRRLYWTESMDLALSSLVRKHFFDFEECAADLAQLDIDFGACPRAALDETACRDRWAQLDVSNTKPAGGPQTVPFGADDFGGKVPSFQQLAAHAAALPSKVTVDPSALPSVDDFDDDGGETLDVYVPPQQTRNVTDFSECD